MGVLGYLGPPFGGDRPPRPKIQLHRLSHITSRSYDFGVGARIKPDHENLIVQSPSTAASGRSVASCAIQSPVPTLATVTTMDQKPLHTFGRQLSKDSASYASIITNEAPPSIEPSKTMYASSAVPTSQKLNGVNDASNVKSLKATNEKSSMIEEPNDIGSVSDKDDDFFHAAMIPKSQVQTSSAGSKHEPRPFKDSWTSQGQHRGHLISHCSRRKTSSSSARFAPYERRQSNASEKTKQRVGGAVDNKYVKPPEIRDDMRMGGNDEGNERKLETTLVEVEKE